ncbi:MAG TPA: DivIVA domain-containing protein [Actinomycetota bacterium]
MAGSTSSEGGFGEAPAPPVRLTPTEIQQKEFAVARLGGYRMRDVDEFLDELTATVGDLLAENERLRRQSGAAPVVGSPDLDDVSRQADEIIQRARDEAAKIVATAKERAATAAGETAVAAGGAELAAVNAFLNQERDFLQSLAALVQDHAGSVKVMAKQARAAAPTPPQQDRPPTARRRAAPPVEGSRADDAPSETIRVEEPAPAAATPPTGETEADSGLRELFWGDDS